jgi:hypothetical protein
MKAISWLKDLWTVLRPLRVPKPIKVIHRESTSLRLEEWRSQPELVAMADAVWKNENFRLMLQVAMNESPGNFAILSGDMETRAMHQARTEGYNLMLANLKAMRAPADTAHELESTYEPEEQTN